MSGYRRRETGDRRQEKGAGEIGRKKLITDN
jgi:hypothetical protein